MTRDPAGSTGYEILTLETGESAITAGVIVRSGSPWFDGHFPDNPILPGIAQMGMVFDLMQRAMGPELTLHGFKRVRFKQLIRPDTPVSVMIKPAVKTPGRYEYRLTAAQDIVCTGFIDVCQAQAAATSTI